jgi:hypothetical protein
VFFFLTVRVYSDYNELNILTKIREEYDLTVCGLASDWKHRQHLFTQFCPISELAFLSSVSRLSFWCEQHVGEEE